VNDALAERLAGRWGIAERPVVIPNYPDLRPLASRSTTSHPDLIRAELGLPSEIRIVAFQGRLGPNLGLDEAAEAILLVPDAALVLIGFGRWSARSAARDRDPRFAGRHFTLPARHPDELPEWTASADASVVPLPPISFNQRHATPNKFWESLAVGTPVVVGPDLPVMDDIVVRDDVGTVAASLVPADLAAAIRSVIDRPADDRARWRERIRTTARERYDWAAAAATYMDLVRHLDGRVR
jgi:glycosyltransferase involved in cell wall biosynthesis